MVSGDPVFAYKRGPRSARKRRETPEADFQRSVMQYLAFALPSHYRIRGATEGARRQGFARLEARGLGLSKGWPDLMLFNRQTRAIRWLELKAPKGALTPEQRAIGAELRDHLVVCRTLEDVEAALVGWGVTPRVPLAKANRYNV